MSDFLSPVDTMIKPYVHYIPVAEDMSDIIEKIQWCLDHPKESQKIVKNAFDFASNFLKLNNIIAFYQSTLCSLPCLRDIAQRRSTRKSFR
jgi:uncharacterized protein Usg